MSQFTVVWTQDAQDQLADLWIDAPRPRRKIITAAVARIDAQLAKEPRRAAQRIREGLCSLEEEGLAVFFSISDDDRLVEVARIRNA